MTMPIVRTVAALREHVAAWKKEGATVAVVPTMGALHAGHLSLVRAALARADRVIVTLFVNPKQFNAASDLAAYPRTEETDAAMIEPLGTHLLYAPDATEIYPAGFQTTVSVGRLAQGLCGAGRPGHFDGVATVVAKLFLQTGADLAFFGEKDFQQLHIVRRMAGDLDIQIEVIGCPTVREEDGLALSSRNVRLSRSQRAVAPRIAAILHRAADDLAAGGRAAAVLDAAAAQLAALPEAELEYFELRDEETLASLEAADRPARLLVAIFIGGVRLIDNVPVAHRQAGYGADKDIRSAA